MLDRMRQPYKKNKETKAPFNSVLVPNWKFNSSKQNKKTPDVQFSKVNIKLKFANVAWYSKLLEMQKVGPKNVSIV